MPHLGLCTLTKHLSRFKFYKAYLKTVFRRTKSLSDFIQSMLESLCELVRYTRRTRRNKLPSGRRVKLHLHATLEDFIANYGAPIFTVKDVDKRPAVLTYIFN